MIGRLGLLGLAMIAATPALAQADEPRFCPNRPSLGSSACITEPGKVQLEVSGVDWQRDDSSDSREDTVLSGDVLARIGLGASTEAQIGWTGFGHVRTRDKTTGAIDTVNGVGDVTLALRQNFANPDGKGLSYGVEPFVTLPVGREPIGAGDWGAGVIVPVTYDLSDKVNLAFTGEADAQPDEDGNGRHFAYSGIVGLGYELSKQWTVVGELSVARDDDPMDKHTEAVAAGSLAWQPRNGLQLDMLGTVGLNHDAPDFRLVTGGAILF
ncbi:transporter [Sphingomonas sp. R86521]|uniref:transporter n=1 Tax=Sphingomonas sp. R86521 TaxID=3093860 RepID=UPI0036D32D88